MPRRLTAFLAMTALAFIGGLLTTPAPADGSRQQPDHGTRMAAADPAAHGSAQHGSAQHGPAEAHGAGPAASVPADGICRG
ncbi:hypothetical protein, partial [Rhodovulum sulfidophilum]